VVLSQSEEIMSKNKLVIQHDLSKLSVEQLEQYKRDVSEFIGLDPDLNGLDTIWMLNENGPGQSLVLYARRGTAEILRQVNKIEVSSLTNQEIRGSIVFTATGKNGAGRQEIATGSKDISKVNGKQLDDAIMTASTRALRRLTMQFTQLGILDESEVRATVAETANPASGAQLIGSPIVIPPFSIPFPIAAPNNAPGKVVGQTTIDHTTGKVTHEAPEVEPETQEQFSARTQALRDDAARQLSTKADIKAAPAEAPTPVTPAVATVTSGSEAAPEPAKVKRGRKPRNTVSLETGPEPEVVSTPAPAPAAATVAPTPVSPQVNPAVPVQVDSVPTQAVVDAPIRSNPAPQTTDFPGKPNETQMGEYRKRVSVYTSELPSSENMGSVQKMRAFITHMSGTAPQFMTTDQWQEMLGWFDQFVEKNKTKGLVTYINDVLGVK
jgi:hypothetical protein